MQVNLPKCIQLSIYSLLHMLHMLHKKFHHKVYLCISFSPPSSLMPTNIKHSENLNNLATIGK
jgi:hypothetical protein